MEVSPGLLSMASTSRGGVKQSYPELFLNIVLKTVLVYFIKKLFVVGSRDKQASSSGRILPHETAVEKHE